MTNFVELLWVTYTLLLTCDTLLLLRGSKVTNYGARQQGAWLVLPRFEILGVFGLMVQP